MQQDKQPAELESWRVSVSLGISLLPLQNEAVDATVMLVQLEEFKVGCPHESSDFDCQAGYDNWKVG